MEKGIDIIWQDNPSQGIAEKIKSLEFCRGPFYYPVYAKTVFRDPVKKATKILNKYAKEQGYDFINIKCCKVVSRTFSLNSFFKSCELYAILYKKINCNNQVLEDID